MSEKPEIRFYYRDGCHLCEEMAAAIHSHWPQVMQEMVWIDVDASAGDRERYGLKVPVLTCNDRTVCEYRLDADAMTVCFGSGVLPV